MKTLHKSIFSTMSQMASEHSAINLSQGFPDFPIDPILKEIIKKTIHDNIHQYCPSNGHPGLLRSISELIHSSYGREITIEDEVIVTAGATQGIFASIQAMVNKGDEVVILDPSYDCYITPILLSGAIPVRVPLNPDFLPDWEAIKDAVNDKTTLIITNNPHNPSGRVWKTEDIKELEYLINKYQKLHVLSDEVYEYINFNNPHQSVHLYESLRKKSIVVSSFGKTFHVTGWKVGYVVAEKQIMDKIKSLHQYMVFSVNSICQNVINDYLKHAKINELSSFYKYKRDLFRKGMKNSRFELMPCEGTYFQLASYHNISMKSDVEYTEELVIDHKIAAIPVSVFSQKKSQKNTIRFCFAKTDETLQSAIEKLCKI